MDELDRKILQHLATEQSNKFRAIAAELKADEGDTSRALQRLELQGKVLRKGVWWKLASPDVVATPIAAPGGGADGTVGVKESITAALDGIRIQRMKLDAAEKALAELAGIL